MPEQLTIRFVHPFDSRHVLIATVTSDATPEFIADQLIQADFIHPAAVGFYYQLFDLDNQRHLDWHVSLGDQGVADGTTLEVAGCITGAGDVTSLLLTLGEVLGSGIAGNAAYDCLKAIVGFYKRSRRTRNVLTIVEAVSIAAAVLEVVDIHGIPIEARKIKGDIWMITALRPSGSTVIVWIYSGDLESAKISILAY
jgi:hypothetical protein